MLQFIIARSLPKQEPMPLLNGRRNTVMSANIGKD
jgi:hypothetical protein